MIYTRKEDRIIINGGEDFSPTHILECGQVFRFKRTENGYIVYSLDKCAEIFFNEKAENSRIEIVTKDVDYFINYFDLNRDYSQIKSHLKQIKFDERDSSFLSNAVEYGHGIRILCQDPFESTISFIISANNNIKRIQGIIERISAKCGTNMGNYYAFPTAEQLSTLTEEDFTALGAGYRAKYLVKAVEMLKEFDYQSFKTLPTDEAVSGLLKIMGVGPKVADCILLFGYNRMDVFPVDTWIEKVYNNYFTATPLKSRKEIRKNLVEIFKNYSGYAQQYLFYYQREL